MIFRGLSSGGFDGERRILLPLTLLACLPPSAMLFVTHCVRSTYPYPLLDNLSPPANALCLRHQAPRLPGSLALFLATIQRWQGWSQGSTLRSTYCVANEEDAYVMSLDLQRLPSTQTSRP